MVQGLRVITYLRQWRVSGDVSGTGRRNGTTTSGSGAWGSSVLRVSILVSNGIPKGPRGRASDRPPTGRTGLQGLRLKPVQLQGPKTRVTAKPTFSFSPFQIFTGLKHSDYFAPVLQTRNRRLCFADSLFPTNIAASRGPIRNPHRINKNWVRSFIFHTSASGFPEALPRCHPRPH